MMSLRAKMTEFVRDERGATAIEYSLIATLVSLMIILGATTIGDALKVLIEKAAVGVKT